MKERKGRRLIEDGGVTIIWFTNKIRGPFLSLQLLSTTKQDNLKLRSIYIFTHCCKIDDISIKFNIDNFQSFFYNKKSSTYLI